MDFYQRVLIINRFLILLLKLKNLELLRFKPQIRKKKGTLDLMKEEKKTIFLIF